MQWMSPSVLLRKRMSSETLEDEDEWTQEEMQQINENKNKSITCGMWPHISINYQS